MLLEIIDGEDIIVINLNNVFTIAIYDDRDMASVTSVHGVYREIGKEALKKALNNLKSNLVKPFGK
jgi:hypothetical protein